MRVHAALIFLVGTSCAAGATAACFPKDDHSVGTEYRQSVAVLVGTVTSETHIPEASPETQDAMSYRVNVNETLKGAHRKTMTVWSENSSGRFPMTVGQSYLLFVYSDGSHLVVNNCGNSGLVSETGLVRKRLDELRASP